MLNCDLIRATRQGRATRIFIQNLDYEIIWTFMEIFPDFETNGSDNGVAFWIKYPTE